MADLFPPAPTDNLLPVDGIVNDLGMVLEDSKALYEQLLNELPWQSDKVTLFGKTHITERQIVWMGARNDDDHEQGLDTEAHGELSYYYSGHRRNVVPWHPAVFHVKRIIEQQLANINIAVNFNSCLLNYYPTGEQGMGYHADDEPELGPQPIIASLSLGAERKFVLKHKSNKNKVELLLQSGQLIVMRGDTQQYWKHTVTKTKSVTQGRISLTFRRMYQ